MIFLWFKCSVTNKDFEQVIGLQVETGLIEIVHLLKYGFLAAQALG